MRHSHLIDCHDRLSTELPKRFDHAEAQSRWYSVLGRARLLPRRAAMPERKPFTIVIPPPNVTGACTWGTR